MSGNGEPIDLNSYVVLGDRELEAHAHGFDLSEPVTDPSNERSKAESPSREVGEDEVKDVEETDSSQKGCCWLESDKDGADASVRYEAADDKFFGGISPGNAKGEEMRRDVIMDAGAKIGDEPSVTVTDLSEAERGCSERMHVSEKIPVVCGEEIVAFDNEVIFEWGNGGGTLNVLPSDASFCCETKGQNAGNLSSLKEFTEAEVADATNGHHSVGIVRNVESQEGVCTMQNKEGKVARDGELAFGSVNVKCDQIVEHCRSHKLLDHGDSIDVLININPEGLCYRNDVHDSVSLQDDLEADSSGSAKDTRQLTDNLSQKAEILKESNGLSPLIATDMRTVPTLDCLENQTRKVGGGQTDENQGTCCHFFKTEASADLDEANLFDVVIEMEPHVIMDEGDASDDANANSDVSFMEFNVSDLVWGKVRGHPWWPGQICDPSGSSKKAMKYFKEDRYLIAFFGDHSFAWKEASMIKPFQEYFLVLQKQSNSESFHQAISCALEEFSRRVEFGLACSCLSKELYSKLQTQTLANAGIRKESSRIFSGDSYLTASTFDPRKLLDIVKEVGRLPCGEANRLELVRALAQLSAFNRWKGYRGLPEFNISSVVFNDAGHLLAGENDYQDELIEDIVTDIEDDEVALYGKGRLKTQDSSSGKRKHNSGDCIYSSKKGKKLPDSLSKNSHHILNDKHGSENGASKWNLQALSKKHEVVDVICNDPAVKHSIIRVSPESANGSGRTNQTFRVGDRMRRVACILNESNPILKHDDGISEAVAENRGNRKPTKIPNKELLFTEYPSDEVFSQLCVAAINPMKGFGFLDAIVNFFSEFRNSVCMDLTNLGELEAWEPVSGGETGKRKEILASTEASESEFIKDSYWTDRLIQGIAEDQSSPENKKETVECQIQPPSEKVIPTVEQDDLLCPGINSTKQQPQERAELEPENCMEDVYPTALILNFTDLGSVPSETNLNNIFRKYGALYESKTEVMKKSSRAKVVFKRSCDAETAFSSAGKYSIFGPSLVSYRLKYLPPTKVSSRPAKRRRKGMTSREENTT